MVICGYKNRTGEWQQKSMNNTSRRGWITSSIKLPKELSEEEKARKEDTEIRKELQIFIRKKHEEGKSKEEILKRLYFIARAPKYQKYLPYFKRWVENVISKEAAKGEERE